MEQIGTVISLDGSKIKVLFNTKLGCGGCAGCKSSCTTGTTFIKIENTINANIGDKVYVTMEKSSYNKMTYLAYLIPTIFLIVGIFIGVYLLKNELLAILIGFVLCFLTYFIFGKLFKNVDFKYKLTKVIK